MRSCSNCTRRPRSGATRSCRGLVSPVRSGLGPRTDLPLRCSRSKRRVLARTDTLPHGPLPPGRTTPDGASSSTFKTSVSCGRVNLCQRPWAQGQGQIPRGRGRGDGRASTRERARRRRGGRAETGAWPGASQGKIGGRQLGVQVSRCAVSGASTRKLGLIGPGPSGQVSRSFGAARGIQSVQR
jgi:hypothetical protein